MDFVTFVTDSIKKALYTVLLGYSYFNKVIAVFI